MRTRFIVIVAAIALLAIIFIVVFSSFVVKAPPAPPALPATIALRKIVTVPALCGFNNDTYLVIDSTGKVYDIKTGALRLDARNNVVAISQNLGYAATNNAVFDMKTGTQLFSFSPNTTAFGFLHFSPDSTLLIVPASGVYQLPSGEKIMTLTTAQIETIVSPDSKSLSITADGVYDLSSGQKRFAFGGTPDNYYVQTTRFSDDSKYLTVEYDGAYEIATGRKVAPEGGGFFTPDDKFVVTRSGVFSTETGKAIFSYYTPVGPVFSDDGKRMLLFAEDPTTTKSIGQGVYDIASGKEILTKPDTFKYMSNDGRLLASSGDGIYDVDTGTKLLTLSSKGAVTFNADGSPAAVEGDGIYDTHSWKRLSQIPDLHNEFINGGRYGFAREVTAQAFSSDNRLFADGKALYEVSTGAKVADGSVHFLKDGSLTVQSSTIHSGKAGGSYFCTNYDVVPASSATEASGLTFMN